MWDTEVLTLQSVQGGTQKRGERQVKRAQRELLKSSTTALNDCGELPNNMSSKSVNLSTYLHFLLII